MQIPADPLDATALAAALLPGRRRYHQHRLEIDWNRDGLYTHTLSDVTRAVSGPGGVRKRWELSDSSPGSAAVASGASAAQLTAVLDGSLLVNGRPVPISELLSPYNSASPLFGVRIGGTRIRWKVATRTSRGWIWLDQFVGQLDERRVVLGGNTVRLTALDTVGNLTGPVFWPPWAVDAVAAARAAMNHETQRGLASSVVDHVLNQAGVRTRPRPPWEHNPAALALVWLPLCGSLAPAVGKMQAKYPWGTSASLFPDKWTQAPATRPDRAYWTVGPFGLARNVDSVTYPGSLLYMGRDTLPVWGSRSSSITAWIYCGPTAPGYDTTPAATLRPPLVQIYYGYFIFAGNYWAGRLGLATNGKVLQIQVEPGTDRIYRVSYTPTTDAWRHVQVQLDHSAGAVRAKMIVDGVERANFVPTGTADSQVGTALNSLFMPELGVRCQPTARCADVMAWQEIGAPTVVPERAVHGGVRAVIDPSLNEISYLPTPTGDHQEVLRAVTAAEGAAVWADEQGVVRWHNRETVRGVGEPVFTLTLASASEVGTVDSATALANAVECSARGGSATWDTAWELPAVDLIHAPPGGSTWEFPTEDTVISVEHGASPRLHQSATSASTVPVWGSAVVGGYIFVYDGGEVEELANQAMIDPVYQYGFGDRQMIRLVISNTGAVAGRFRFKNDSASGTDARPALRIAGYVLARADPETATETHEGAVTVAGRVDTLRIGGSSWHQHLASVTALARHILRRATQLIPTFDRVEIPADPRLQLADSGVLELGPAGARVRVYLAGITRAFDDTGLHDSLAVRATHAPGRWALGDEVLGVLGATAVLG